MFFLPKPEPKPERKKAKEMLTECSQTMDNVECQIKKFIRSHLELVDKEEHDVE